MAVGAAAHGIQRDDKEALAHLASLRFGVRIDQPGVQIRDFQTAHHADTHEAAPVSERFYLCDAVFLAAVEGPHKQLTNLHAALRRPPEFLPYLGRRSCPPAEPIPIRVHDSARLEDILPTTPWLASSWCQKQRSTEEAVDLTLLIESDGTKQTAQGDTVRDQPLSYDPRHRRYALRTVHTASATVPNPHAKADHDPVGHLGEA